MTTRIGTPQVGQQAANGFGGLTRSRLAIAGVGRHDQPADGLGREGTAGMEKAEVANLHKTVGQDMLEEPPDKLQSVEAAWCVDVYCRVCGR